MNKETLRTTAIQKSLGVSQQDARKILIFIAGMDAGKNLQNIEKAEKPGKCEKAV